MSLSRIINSLLIDSSRKNYASQPKVLLADKSFEYFNKLLVPFKFIYEATYAEITKYDGDFVPK